MDALICAEAHGDPWPDVVKAADFKKLKAMNAAQVSQMFKVGLTCLMPLRLNLRKVAFHIAS
jgi:hypothetical protein